MTDAVVLPSAKADVVAPSRLHIPSLDGLRGIAILMVLAVHLVELVPRTQFMKYVRGLVWCGWSGVDLFFVLSGFLITGILLDSRSSSNYFRSFYIRRCLRILPLYYFSVLTVIVVLTLCVLKYPSLGNYKCSTAGWLSYVFYYQNWWIPIEDPARTILRHFWSLGVEEQFYMLWPAVVWLIPARRLKWICLGACVSALLLRCILAEAGSGPGYTLDIRMQTIILMNTFTRADSLLIGGALALVVRDAKLQHLASKVVPLVFSVSVAGIAWITVIRGELMSRGYFTSTIGFTLYACFYACVLFWAFLQHGTRSRLNRVLSLSILRKFGKYSYGIYVYHGVIFFVLARSLKSQNWYGNSTLAFCLLGPALVAISYGVAVLSFRYLESPFLSLKQRFEASDRQAAFVA